MKNKLFITLLAGVFVLGLFSLAQAGKPTRPGFYCSADGTSYSDELGCLAACREVEAFCSEADIYVGNGYPSGKHYNLNIKAHKNFSCPAEDDVMKGYCPDPEPKVFDSLTECNFANPLAVPPEDNCTADCFEVFSNVIHFPTSNQMDSYSILMESGRVKPRGKPDKFDDTEITYPDLLEVTDWCMGGGDTNAAFRLPADPEGYAVFARLVGDPKDSPQFDFTVPELSYVEDTNQDILLLGFITPDGGVFNQKGELVTPVTRTKGKKVNPATNITPMFMWEGDICTFGDYGGIETPKCCSTDDLTIIEDPEDVITVTGVSDGFYDSCVDPSITPHCCIDELPDDPGPDGAYDSCVLAIPGDPPT
ncbi:hypothetical protein ACFLZ5_11925, partial [Thermodesulfobacteriota bacterium]